jgi:hypothetical protein
MQSRPNYIIVKGIIAHIHDICNTLISFQFVNLVFIVKQWYSHLNKRSNNWIFVSKIRQINLMEENERCIRFQGTVDHTNKNRVSFSYVGNIEGSLRQTDIYLLLQIYSELYDKTCLINETDSPFLLICPG